MLTLPWPPLRSLHPCCSPVRYNTCNECDVCGGFDECDKCGKCKKSIRMCVDDGE